MSGTGRDVLGPSAAVEIKSGPVAVVSAARDLAECS